MRRSVDRGAASRWAGRWLAPLALLSAGAAASEGDAPELQAPSEKTIISKPSIAPTPAPAPPSVARQPATTRNRAVLAIPGMMAPPRRPAEARAPAVEPPSTLSPLPNELSLDAPLEMKPSPNAGRVVAAPGGSRSDRPLTLESSPMDEPMPIDSPIASSSRPKPTPPPAVQAPTRRSRMFGLFPGTALAPKPATAAASSASKVVTPGRASADGNLREDVAAESALKRRIERQAREVVGNRARSVEVRVTGKEAAIRVSGTKMFQRRAIRKQLENIPAISGLRSTIDVAD